VVGAEVGGEETSPAGMAEEKEVIASTVVETWSAGVDIAHRSGIENDCPDTELTRRFCRDKPWLGLCLFYTSGVGTRLTQQGKTDHKLIFAMNKRYTQSYPSFNKGVRHP
jgi:hypothetical protein